MGIDLVTHVPYLVVICVLIVALISLSVYLLCSTKNKRSASSQTYYTCMPKQLSPAEREAHGLQTVDVIKGERMGDTQSVRYGKAPAALYHKPEESSASGKRKKQAPDPPTALSSTHDYVNAHAWTDPSADGSGYRVSQIEPLYTNRGPIDDDLISAAFTNDSFETYDEEYINTATINQMTH